MAKISSQKRRLRKSGRFEDLVRIMEILLGENGCPWDRRQTHKTLLKYLKEEANEVSAAVRKNDWENLKEELGDVLLQVVFHSALAAKASRFGIGDVIRTVNSKLVRRHPHVFGGVRLSTPAEVLVEWRKIKRREKFGRGARKRK
ncbi:MAG: nucleotide pyrophosphohydrolase [Elusimicrobia bacterium]|nr:nucleotide pyrophosphohydrolase [Elusimicrobiota bacterium]